MAFVLIVAVFAALAVFVARDGAPLEPRTRPWVIGLAGAAAVFGVVCRLYRFDRSLWIDEFGTLWALEASLGETVYRAVTFHGQSPLYYVVVWPLIHLFGESEVLLRLPSLVCGLVSTVLIFRTAGALASSEAGLFAATLFWLAPSMMEASVNARAYAPAAMFAALACYGFASAVVTGQRRHRLYFVAGGAGLFLTQYVSSLVMLGMASGYLLWPLLRIRYPFRRFVVDVTLQCGLALLALPQIVALWGRRGGLDWIGPPDYLVFAGLLGPFLVPLIAGALREDRIQEPQRRAVERSLMMAIAAQVAGLTVLALVGTNLLAPRYLMIVVAPAAILAGVHLSRQRSPSALVAVVFAVVLAAAASARSWQVNGLLTTVPHQDWRTAVRALDVELRRAPHAFILYRPGFVEQDPDLPVVPALNAPLRSPGTSAPDWPLVPLTFSWWSASRELYFDRVIAPRLASAETFFLLNSGTTPKTGDYARLLLSWIDQRFPGQFTLRSVVPVTGVDLLRFDRVAQGG